MLQNSRIGRGKHKSEEHILHFQAFKRKKLDRVGQDLTLIGSDGKMRGRQEV